MQDKWSPVFQETMCHVTSKHELRHHSDVIMGTVASQITSVTIVYSVVNSDADQRKHQSSASLPLVRGIHRGLVNSPHKWPVTRKMFLFYDVIMISIYDKWSTTLHECHGCALAFAQIVNVLRWRLCIVIFHARAVTQIWYQTSSF